MEFIYNQQLKGCFFSLFFAQLLKSPGVEMMRNILFIILMI
jgi:hypothetical protein